MWSMFPAVTPSSMMEAMSRGMTISKMTSPSTKTGVRMETRLNSLTWDRMVFSMGTLLLGN